MPKAKQTNEQILDEAEKFFLEKAKAYYRDLRQAAQNAPYGKIIAHADAFVFEKGKELLQQSLEGIVQEQNDLLEKKELRECDCGRKREPLGYRSHKILSSSG